LDENRAKLLLAVTAVTAILAWTAEAAAEPPLLAPVTSACISSPFGPRVLPEHPQAGTYHYGVDLPAALGSPVVAAAPGEVIRVQRKGPGGLEMLIQHDGFVGIYSHFGMITPAFAEGKRTVAAGEKLGVVGRTGLTSGAHLYFEMIVAGKPVDPAPYLGVVPCGAEARRQEPAAGPTPASDGITVGSTIGGRTYYQLLMPSGQN
jgi:murein DD-endopeptidase MepM/ murein hydrolase activator NlpD